jgi:hypothetical protein
VASRKRGNTGTSRLKVFCDFAKAHVASRDIDPAYPVLADAYDILGLDFPTRVWRTVLYVTFYHLGSTEEAWEKLPELPTKIPAFTFPTGVERRGFRGQPNRVAQHLEGVLKASTRAGGLDKWAEAQVGEGGEEGWTRTRKAFEALPHAGPWASYKWADLLKHSLGLPIDAPDIGVGGKGKTAGPVPGMVWLTGLDWKTCATDFGEQRRLLDECLALGVPFSGLDQLETSLCDFNSLRKGHYYVGHDMDMMMTHLRFSGETFWKARQRVLPGEYLGELWGWNGVRKEKKGTW